MIICIYKVLLFSLVIANLFMVLRDYNAYYNLTFSKL